MGATMTLAFSSPVLPAGPNAAAGSGGPSGLRLDLQDRA
jgi:hypothetical protein